MSAVPTRGYTPDSIGESKQDIRILKQLTIVWFVVLLWDTIATFPSEYRYIWKAKWTPLKIAFLVNRYWTICAQASTAFLLLAPIAPDTCYKIFWGFAADGISIMFICDCIVAIRVYAVYEKSRKILYLLIGMLVLDLGMMAGAASQLRAVIYPPEVAEALDFKGCSAAIPNSSYSWLISVLYWSPPLLFNMIALALIFHRNLEISRQARRVPILQRMLRDGLFFFLVIMAANLVNVVFAAQSNPSLKNLNVPASLTLTSLMCSRLVLSLHQHNRDVRMSQAGGGGTVDRITSNPQASFSRRASVSAFRSRARGTSRPHLFGLDEEEDPSPPRRESPSPVPRRPEPASSRESLNDKFRYNVQTPLGSDTSTRATSEMVQVLDRIGTDDDDEEEEVRPPSRRGIVEEDPSEKV